MIDDHAPLSSFTSTARQALCGTSLSIMISTPNCGDQVEEIRFPSLQASIFPRFPRLLWKDSTIRRIQKLSDSGGRISGLSTTLTQRGGIREQPRSRAQGHGRVVFLTFNHDYIIKLNMT